MRIVSGTYRGRRLTVPEGRNVRPTTDRVRESLFNVLEHSDHPIQGARVLDLFAGSGALGLEALSRGAEAVLFVEADAKARGAIRTNIETLGAQGSTRVYKRDATSLGRILPNRGGPFDLIFLDPPYGRGLIEQALASALEGGWLTEDAFIVVECGKSERINLAGFEIADERTYGDTRIIFAVGKS